MTAGLPGTGISGIFYILSALFMPFKELRLTLKGESSLSRWGQIGRQVLTSVSVIAMIWIVGLALGYFLPAESQKVAPAIFPGGNFPNITVLVTALPFATLAVVLSVPYLYSLIFPNERGK